MTRVTDSEALRLRTTEPEVRRRTRRHAVRRWLAGHAIALIAVVVVIIGIAIALRPSPVPVETAGARRGRLLVTVSEVGETRVRDRFVVSAPVTGRVKRIALEPGDPVAANRTVLAELLPTPPTLLDTRTRAELRARVEQADASRARADAEIRRISAALQQAERELERSQRLVAAGAIAPEQVEQDQLAARSLAEARAAAVADLRAAEWAVRGARASLAAPSPSRTPATLPLVAPADGVVLQRHLESEAVVPAGTPLLEVGDVAKLEIVAEFLSTDAVAMAPGQRMLIDGWGGAGSLEARIRRIEPAAFTKISALGVEEQRVRVIAEVPTPPDDWARVGDRYRLTVRVVTTDLDDALLVPTSSLVRDGTSWSVFVVADGRARRQPVELGPRNERDAAITAGLEEGQTVIDYPGDEVADGVAVAASS